MKYVEYFREHPLLKKILLFLASFCVLWTMLVYGLLISYLFIQKIWVLFFKTLLIPLSTIILVEVIRHFVPRARPFEVHHFTPLIEHSTGKSFPSKHATSAMIIALSLYQISPLFSFIMIINALIVGLTRILSGIHFPSDVLGGYLLAILMSLFYLL